MTTEYTSKSVITPVYFRRFRGLVYKWRGVDLPRPTTLQYSYISILRARHTEVIRADHLLNVTYHTELRQRRPHGFLSCSVDMVVRSEPLGASVSAEGWP